MKTRTTAITIMMVKKENKLTNDYIDALWSIVSRTTKKVRLIFPRMDYDQFSTIVKASRHVDTLIFNHLHFEEEGKINLGLGINYNIRNLSLQYSELGYRTWNEKMSWFFDVVQEIKNSNMHKNLESLNICGLKVDIDQVDLPGIHIATKPWDT